MKSPRKLHLPLLVLNGILTIVVTSCGGTTRQGSGLSATPVPVTTKSSAAKPNCYGTSLKICDFPGQYHLDEAISLVLKNIQDSKLSGVPSDSLHGAQVACAEVAYPGSEKAIMDDSAHRGTFICLFNNSYSMNMSLNRLSTFIEDFEVADATLGYDDGIWAKKQATEKTMGHNLESPDIKRYVSETKHYIEKRAKSTDLGTSVESEFLSGFILPKIDETTGKPKSVILGVPLPEAATTPDPEAQLTAVLGHEIFHALYFHSNKLQSLAKNFIDNLGADDRKLLTQRLSQKGYAVTNSDGTPPSPKQTYMFYNETVAYLLESGACSDGAFVSYVDSDAEEPHEVIPQTAPLVVDHAANLRKILVSQGTISQSWADQWSPDLTKKIGCKKIQWMLSNESISP